MSKKDPKEIQRANAGKDQPGMAKVRLGKCQALAAGRMPGGPQRMCQCQPPMWGSTEWLWRQGALCTQLLVLAPPRLCLLPPTEGIQCAKQAQRVPSCLRLCAIFKVAGEILGFFLIPFHSLTFKAWPATEHCFPSTFAISHNWLLIAKLARLL